MFKHTHTRTAAHTQELVRAKLQSSHWDKLQFIKLRRQGRGVEDAEVAGSLFLCLSKSGRKKKTSAGNAVKGSLQRVERKGEITPPSATLQACATFGYLLKKLLTQSLAVHFICAGCLK